MINFKQAQQHLNGLTAQAFLDQYWQKKPLLIRNAFPEFQNPEFNPLTPDELAGLALEKDIASRLLLGSHPENQWTVEHGPFSEERFTELPQSNWSLLVSDVEKHLPDFLQFTDYFRFVPDWRVDDLMVSYAPKGGSVGKHTDEYDVFLLQTHGQRRWQIEETRSTSAHINNLEIKVLEHFAPTQDWVLNPGDMLYLPPGIAHYGVAENDCMTWSFGFRAPSWQFLLQDFSDSIAEKMTEEQRYSDPRQNLQANPAEISADSLKTIRQKLNSLLQMDNNRFADWLGSAVSQQACEFPIREQETLDVDSLSEQLHAGRVLMLNPYVRLCFVRAELTKGSGYQVYINGDCAELYSPFVEIFSEQRRIALDGQVNLTTETSLLQWLCDNFAKGYWLWEDELLCDEVED